MKWFILSFLCISMFGDVITTLYLISTRGIEGEFNPLITGSESLIVTNFSVFILSSALLLFVYPTSACRDRIRNMSYRKILNKLTDYSTPIREYFRDGESKDALIFFTIVMLLAMSFAKMFVVASNTFVIFTGYGYVDVLLVLAELMSISLSRTLLFLISLISSLLLGSLISFILLKKHI